MSFAIASGLGVGQFALLLFLIVIALDNWTINVLNLYTGGLSLSNMFERLGRFWTTVIISVLGIALSATPSVVTGYTAYVGMLGNVFSPIAGVLIADYIFVKRMKIDLVALFEPNGPYWYWKGVNPVAVVWTALGFLAYMFVIPAEWIKVLVTVVATGAGYWATTVLLAPRLAELGRAARPATSARRSRTSIGNWRCANEPGGEPRLYPIRSRYPEVLADEDLGRSGRGFPTRERAADGGPEVLWRVAWRWSAVSVTALATS